MTSLLRAVSVCELVIAVQEHVSSIASASLVVQVAITSPCMAI